ncbi:unnamed protein product [Brassica oleracea var. botrytis]|uniref:(rape) hypothetical protein n=1 Tax=Brassica napus TaxID=3708 RepID=A0A816M0L0_BRANA|nr:unnamed protein product [Brassica napus]
MQFPLTIVIDCSFKLGVTLERKGGQSSSLLLLRSCYLSNNNKTESSSSSILLFFDQIGILRESNGRSESWYAYRHCGRGVDEGHSPC